MNMQRGIQMNNNYNVMLKVFGALGVGIVVGIVAPQFWVPEKNSESHQNVEKKPMYWVAPMDPNYRRDEPGQSPMGMDLIPFYDEGEKSSNTGPGTIRISPDVVNNLGVRVAVAERKALQSEIVTVGYVQFDEDRLIHIHPRISGWIDKLYVKATGDPVEKGAPLYAIYSPELVNAQEELILALNRKNSRLIRAAEQRLKALELSMSFIDKLKSTKKISHTVIFHAPQNGVVDNLNIREGFYVKPGTTMLSIGSLEQVWVEAEVFERQASLVKVNDTVTMTLDYLPGKSWEGHIDYIYPTLDKKTRTARIRLRFPNADGQLKPNMFAQVAIHSGSKEKLLVIPREALIRTGQQDRVVLALAGGSYKSIEVKVGRLDQNSVEIIKGLKEGEKVVTSAQFLLDSESSKTSDFKRMNHEEEQPHSVWVAGKIKSVMKDNRMATIEHEAIEAWGWPEMIMDFQVSDEVDFEPLRAGTELHMEITKGDDGQLNITGTHIMDTVEDESEDAQTANTYGSINSIDVQSRVLNIDRGPIEKWQRPAATLNFIVGDNIDISKLNSGSKISFTFKISGERFVITQLEQE